MNERLELRLYRELSLCSPTNWAKWRGHSPYIPDSHFPSVEETDVWDLGCKQKGLLVILKPMLLAAKVAPNNQHLDIYAHTFPN